MKSLVIAAVVLTLASAQADAKDINPILQQIIKAHGGCVPSHDIAIKERDRLQKEGIDTKGCVDPKLLSDEELTRVRTYEDEQMRYPPSVMTLSWFEKGIKDFHRNVVLDPLFARLPECKEVRVLHLPDADFHIYDVQLAAHSIVQHSPLVVRYSINDNIFDASPETAVRLACFAAKAKNRNW